MTTKQVLIAALLALATCMAAAQGPAPQKPKAPVVTEPRTVPVTPAPDSATAAAPAQETLANGAHALTAADVDAWLDGYMPYAMATGDIAGSVVVVVKDGQIVTERGFGYADIAKKIGLKKK